MDIKEKSLEEVVLEVQIEYANYLTGLASELSEAIKFYKKTFALDDEDSKYLERVLNLLEE